MPILDIHVVGASSLENLPVSAQAIADAVGHALGSAPGRTWVRVHPLPAAAYAENETALPAADLPVFVSVLQAHPPAGEALAPEALALTRAVARLLGRPLERVHVQYAPAAAGRQAFGGTLVE